MKTIIVKLKNQNQNAEHVKVVLKTLKHNFNDIVCRYMEYAIKSHLIIDLIRFVLCVNVVYALYHKFNSKNDTKWTN